MKKNILFLNLLCFFASLHLSSQTLKTDTFYYTGSTQTFVIPQCVSNLTVVLYGAEGGADSIRNGYGKGQGARLYVVISPTTGALLNLNVGGSGHTYYGGWNGGGNGGWGAWSPGGGGGGSTDIRIGGNTLSHRIFVAGGGGGSGGGTVGFGMFGSLYNVGAWGGEGGSNACTSTVNPYVSLPACPPTFGCGGGSGSTLGSGPSAGSSFGACNGATVTGPGAGGGGGGMNSGGGVSTHTNGCPGTIGNLWQGGKGGDSTCTVVKGFFGGGGGGGGYYGGGGGHSSGYVTTSPYPITGGGGGGSSYLNNSFVLTYSLYGGFYGGIPWLNPYTGAEGGVIYFSYYINGPNVNASASQNSICAGQALTLTAGGVSSYTWLPTTGFAGSNSATVNVSPGASTQYTVHGLNSLGCTSQTVVSVHVETTPAVQVSPVFPAICPGDSIAISASGASSYSWSNGQNNSSIIVSPGATTIYTLNASASATNTACLASKTIQVLVYPLPSLTVTATKTLICLNEPVTVAAGGALTYTWMTSGGSHTVNLGSMIVQPAISTTFSVTGAGANTCKSYGSVNIQVDACTSIHNIELNEAEPGIKVHPNPNNGEFTVESSTKVKVTVHNALGAIVYQSDVEENTHHLSLADKANGVYFVQLKTGETSKVIRVIKN